MSDTVENDVEQTLIAAANAASQGNDDIQYLSKGSSKDEETESSEVSNDCPIKKRKLTDDATYSQEGNSHYNDENPIRKRKSSDTTYSEVVATHYNLIKEKGLDERSKSSVVYLRNFHNWIKSMLINEYLTKVKDKKKHNAPIRVHDMCCGKGGDLQKWKMGGITHLICSDIASVSLDDCKSRYNNIKSRIWGRGSSNMFTIEYIVGDCTRMRVREKLSDPSMKLDIVSCQFAFHYCFESLPQAECMLRNAAECLLPGGYFIGTMTDAYDLIARARKCNSNTYGNRLYTVTLDFDINKPALFGEKCHFQLADLVDCPEFLVHFPTFIKLAKKYGLKFVKKEKFYDFFERLKSEGQQLLCNLPALETYPPSGTSSLLSTDPDDYTHAKEFIERQGEDNIRIGTLSKSEWEASSIYTTFVFEKVKNTWNTDGTPIFDI
ncbi:hypothetical protein NQ315_004717 [Exocentrus adspersus]|uniref:mRNA cap guanine-N(7) methyltransferase n=1 Tax=Exocentrus adspersus TaxID=1586481 RepID=A0AAV8W263_9CUCU|nr:hypothetical protein NQ315_004717 [Exocentrus adspersus]